MHGFLIENFKTPVVDNFVVITFVVDDDFVVNFTFFVDAAGVAESSKMSHVV